MSREMSTCQSMFTSPTGHPLGFSFTQNRSFERVPPLGPLSSKAQPIVLPRYGAKCPPVVFVTRLSAQARPPPTVVGRIARHVGFELKVLGPATHWPSGTLALAEPRTPPSRRYNFTANDASNTCVVSFGHPAWIVPAPITYPLLCCAAAATLPNATTVTGAESWTSVHERPVGCSLIARTESVRAVSVSRSTVSSRLSPSLQSILSGTTTAAVLGSAEPNVRPSAMTRLRSARLMTHHPRTVSSEEEGSPFGLSRYGGVMKGTEARGRLPPWRPENASRRRRGRNGWVVSHRRYGRGRCDAIRLARRERSSAGTYARSSGRMKRLGSSPGWLGSTCTW